MDNKLKQRILWLMGVCFVILACVACDDDPSPQPNNPLSGTKWKFLGFYDVEVDTLRDPYCGCSNEVVFLEFVKNTGQFSDDILKSDTGVMINTTSSYGYNFLLIGYNIDYTLSCINSNAVLQTGAPCMSSIDDIFIYYNVFYKNIKFYHKENILKFYYNDNRNYLLYTKVI